MRGQVLDFQAGDLAGEPLRAGLQIGGLLFGFGQVDPQRGHLQRLDACIAQHHNHHDSEQGFVPILPAVLECEKPHGQASLRLDAMRRAHPRPKVIHCGVLAMNSKRWPL